MGIPTDGYAIYDVITPDHGQAVWGPRLDKIAAAGFSLVMNYNAIYGSMANLIAYINYAASKGLKVIVSLKDPAIWRDNGIASTYPTMYANAGSPATYVDSFLSDTSTNYTSNRNNGGTAGTWTWDTGNSRLTSSGGVEAALVYNGITMTDGYIEVCVSQAISSAGIECRRTDNNNLYALYLNDASNASNANTWQLYKIVGNVYTRLANGSISFTRGTSHVFRLQAVGSTISASMDGVLLGSVTDTSLSSSGKCGLIGAGDGSTNYFNSVSIQASPSFISYIINQVDSLPGVWGYYVGDEPAPSEHPALLHHAYDVKMLTSKPRLLIETWTGNDRNFYAGTAPFWDCCDVGGDDYYPYERVAIESSAAQVAAGIQSVCTSKGIQSAMVLQAFSWNPPATPDFPSLSYMGRWRMAVLANMTPRLLMWYSYYQIWNSPDIAVTPPTDPATIWNNLVSALSYSTTLSQSPYYPQVMRSGPLRYYSCREPSGIYALDASKNLQDAPYNNNNANGLSGITQGQRALLFSQPDTSILLNGSSGYIAVPVTGFPSGSQAIAVECWLYMASLPNPANFPFIVDMGFIVNNQELSLYMNNNQIQGGYRNTSNVASGTVSAQTVYYVVLLYDGSNLKLYLNGVLQQSTATTPNLTLGSCTIGCQTNNTNYWAGNIGQIAFYGPGSIPTNAQINARYHAGIAGLKGRALGRSLGRVI